MSKDLDFNTFLKDSHDPVKREEQKTESLKFLASSGSEKDVIQYSEDGDIVVEFPDEEDFYE